MKKLLFTLLVCLATRLMFAGNLLNESFEYANHDFEKPVGWISDDNAWLCGYLEKDHNRIPHTGNWYAFSATDDAWMYMPLYMIPGIRYRFSCWAISNGACQLEFWAGADHNPDDMHTLLLSATVASGEYERFSSFVETFPNNCEYIAVHAVGLRGNTLTIDDIEIDMVEQYQFEASEITGDTVLYPGTEAVFRFLIHNTGYDPVDVTVHPSNEFFTDFSFYSNGSMATTFPTEPDEFIEVTCHATLRPEVEPGSVAWLDIQMTIPCNCNTAMVTFWVTPLDPTQVEENIMNISIFPNPATDFVTIESEDMSSVEVWDATGRMIKSVPANGNALQIDLSGIKAGIYLISAKTHSTSSFVKSILKM